MVDVGETNIDLLSVQMCVVTAKRSKEDLLFEVLRAKTQTKLHLYIFVQLGLMMPIVEETTF